MPDARQLPLPVASPEETVALFRYGLIADPGHLRVAVHGQRDGSVQDHLLGDGPQRRALPRRALSPDQK
jgi:hypothetical protein